MAIFNINIEDSGTILNPENLNIYYGSSNLFPSDAATIKLLNTQPLKKKVIDFELNNIFRRHSIILPVGVYFESIVNVNNLNELITEQYEKTNDTYIIDGFNYYLYKLENAVPYKNKANHIINLEGEYNG